MNIIQNIYIKGQHQCPGRQFPNATGHGYTKLLFNLVNDPYETANIAPEYPQVANELEQLLPPGFCN